MFVLEYLFFLGIAFIVFWLVNALLGLLAALAITITKLDKLAYITTALSGYVFVSLAVLLTLGFIHMNPGTASTIVLPIIGGLIVFMSLGQSVAERERKLIETHDYESLALLRYDGLFVIGLTVLFVVMLFVPFIAQNPFTMRLLTLIDWAYNVRILGWILRIGGALFMLAFVFQGFFFIIALIGSVIGAFRKGEEELNWFQRHLNWTWVFAWLIWIPLNASDDLVAQIIGAILLLFVSGWVIKRKGRSLWWILLTPVFSPLWLRNKRAIIVRAGEED